MTASTVPEFGVGDHSFCRNPDRSAGGVWCYVAAADGIATRALCDVPTCTDEQEAEVLSLRLFNAGPLLYYIIVAVLFLGMWGVNFRSLGTTVTLGVLR